MTITIQERLVGIKCCQPTMKRLEKIELKDIFIDIIEQLFNILAFIHANNILHLDISMDFNSSHLKNGIRKPIFKFPYTHPVEQWRFSPAADLYSSGIVISEIVNRIYCEKEPTCMNSYQDLGTMGAREIFLRFQNDTDQFLAQIGQLLQYIVCWKIPITNKSKRNGNVLEEKAIATWEYCFSTAW